MFYYLNASIYDTKIYKLIYQNILFFQWSIILYLQISEFFCNYLIQANNKHSKFNKPLNHKLY